MVQPCAGGTQIENGGWGYGRVGLGRISKGLLHLASMLMVGVIAIDAVGFTKEKNHRDHETPVVI